MEDQTAFFQRSSPSTKSNNRAAASSSATTSAAVSSRLPSSVTPKSIASSTLRFPTPEGSHLLANWVTSSSSPETMDTTAPFGPSDETSSLADSAYELISSTDGESQDGRGTDSVADSLDIYPRAEDVHSLNGNDANSNDGVDDESISENDDADQHQPANTSNSTPCHGHLYQGKRHPEEAAQRRSSQADSIQYAEDVLGSPSTQSIANLDDSSGDLNGPTPLVQSIELNETNAYHDRVSARHTIRNFDETETVAISKTMGRVKHPKHLAATICQDMSHHYLLTATPLRVLYVGSEAGYSDIMYKISSALLASASNRASQTSESHDSTSSIYNIMPISAFGSSKVPEIDEIQLMGVSDYYIKVERCAEAGETPCMGGSYPSDMAYSITLDNGKKYVSVPKRTGGKVSPKWALPQVAVFYLSGNDDSQAEKTRGAAWEFMTRHSIPSIFISHTLSFSRPPGSGRWWNTLNRHAVHLCLESRDPEYNLGDQRLPIDMASFLNIDARQMNRNLAYITGLKEMSEERKALYEEATKATLLRAFPAQTFREKLENARMFYYQWTKYYIRTFREEHLEAIVLTAIGTLVWALILSVFNIPWLLSAGGFQSGVATTTTGLSVLTPSATGLTAESDSSALWSTTTPMCSVPSVTPTVTISFTSTKTVQLRVEEPSTSTAHFGGFLTDRAYQQTGSSVSQTEIKRTGCSIQVYSSHEILVKVPAGTKTTWLAKGAIDIDVWRGQEILKSRLSTIDEGIIIEINKKDAYGVMNVSIVTTRRPKINETFAVDFGTRTMAKLVEAGVNAGTRIWFDTVQTITNTGREAVAQAESAALPFADRMAEIFPAASDMVHNAAEKASLVADSLADSLTDGMKRAGQKAQASTSGLVDKLVHDTQAIVDQAREQLAPLDRVRDNVGLPVLRAQIASKLWWMRINGKLAEYADYEAKAERYLREKEKEVERKVEENRYGSASGRSGSHRGWRGGNKVNRGCTSGSCTKASSGEHRGRWQFMGRSRAVRG